MKNVGKTNIYPTSCLVWNSAQVNKKNFKISCRHIYEKCRQNLWKDVGKNYENYRQDHEKCRQQLWKV
jgi:hypothetical protein